MDVAEPLYYVRQIFKFGFHVTFTSEVSGIKR